MNGSTKRKILRYAQDDIFIRIPFIMKILSECNLAQLVIDLLDGQTVVFPTETTYGLGCDATNRAAVENIFKIKGRRPDKPLLVVVPTIEMAKKYLVWSPALDQIAAKYWPGPLTIVGEYARPEKDSENTKILRSAQDDIKDLAPGVVSSDNTLAIRVSAHLFIKSVTEKLGRPLVATSANIADAGELFSSDDVVAQFKDRAFQPDIILNNGILPKHLPTTIVRVRADQFEILRQGELTIAL